jgi:hypothetical protein
MATIAELAAAARRRAAGTPDPTPPPPAPAPAPAPVIIKPAPPVAALATSTLLVDFTVRMYTGGKTDSKVSEEVRVAKGATTGAGRYVKNLIPNTFIDPLKKLAQGAGEVHRKRTSEWNGSQRILNAAEIEAYVEEMQPYEDQWQPAVDYLLDHYEDMLEAAAAEQGAMFDRSEYPSQRKLAERYSFGYDITNTPTSGDVRVDVSNHVLDRIRRSMDTAAEARVKAVQNDLCQRINEVVARMAERLRTYTGTRDGAFRDSLVSNVDDMAGLVRSLNITGDPRFDTLADDMRRTLCQATPQELREDDKAREVVADAAEDILARVSQLMK